MKEEWNVKKECAFCGDEVLVLKEHYKTCEQIKHLKNKYGEKEFMRLYGKRLK